MPLYNPPATGTLGALVGAVLFDSTLGADAASFDATSLSGAYSTLLICGSLRGTTAATNVQALLTFNNDSGSNYDYAQQYSNSSAGPSKAASFAQTAISLIPGNVTAASVASGYMTSFMAHVFNYAGTSFHKGMAATSFASRGAADAYVGECAAEWRSTSAITRVTLAPAAGNWLAGSRLTIYGIG